ncbi:MAG: stage II sporulation protein P [Oscillospiraceae bacterium]|nr:stage II sporulation protein P [Oscillospiraceae bacterium]
MRKGIVSMALCLCAMRLAVAAGAEEGVRNLVRGLERELAYVREEMSEEELVGEIDVVPVVFYKESGELALNYGEEGVPVAVADFSGELSVRNDSGLSVDIPAYLEAGINISLSGEGPQILIVHTHGSEAYTQWGTDRYEESDPYRTEDKSQNVIKVGDVLAQTLEKKGLTVIHDREIYDYPSYTGSYSRSGAAVEKYLEKYPTISIVIDLHRDALGSGDTVYKTKAEASLGECAQLMLLVGTGQNGLYHPNWEENLKLALYLQKAMEQSYPSLARPLALKSERYNQHLSTGSLIIEVGSTGNTLAEAERAVELFGDVAGEALRALIDE